MKAAISLNYESEVIYVKGVRTSFLLNLLTFLFDHYVSNYLRSRSCKHLWSVDFYCSPPLPVIVPASTGQGLQISAQLIRRDGQVFYSMMFENNTQVPLDGFMIQFNKNTFGLAAGGPLQVSIILPLVCS